MGPSWVTVVTDTGAPSCLWSISQFYICGFTDKDLLPVRRSMVAANSEEIKIVGAVFIRLSGTDAQGVELAELYWGIKCKFGIKMECGRDGSQKIPGDYITWTYPVLA